MDWDEETQRFVCGFDQRPHLDDKSIRKVLCEVFRSYELIHISNEKLRTIPIASHPISFSLIHQPVGSTSSDQVSASMTLILARGSSAIPPHPTPSACWPSSPRFPSSAHICPNPQSAASPGWSRSVHLPVPSHIP